MKVQLGLVSEEYLTFIKVQLGLVSEEYLTFMKVQLGLAGVSGQNYRPVANHWQTVSHDVVSSTPSHERDPNSQISLYITISCSIFDSNNLMAIKYFGCKWLIDIKSVRNVSYDFLSTE